MWGSFLPVRIFSQDIFIGVAPDPIDLSVLRLADAFPHPAFCLLQGHIGA